MGRLTGYLNPADRTSDGLHLVLTETPPDTTGWTATLVPRYGWWDGACSWQDADGWHRAALTDIAREWRESRWHVTATVTIT